MAAGDFTERVSLNSVLGQPISSTNPVPVSLVQGVALTDHSGTITTGGAAQQVAAANSARQYLTIVNVDTHVLWVNFGATAVQSQPSIPLKACTAAGDGTGGSLTFQGVVPTGLVSVIGGTTGQAFVCKEA